MSFTGEMTVVDAKYYIIRKVNYLDGAHRQEILKCDNDIMKFDTEEEATDFVEYCKLSEKHEILWDQNIEYIIKKERN